MVVEVLPVSKRSSNIITNGDMHMHEIRQDDPPHVKALKQHWEAVAKEEMTAADEMDRCSDVVRQWEGKVFSANRAMITHRNERLKIQKALRALKEPLQEQVGIEGDT